jgi:multiple sugar transport system substrate-binding protein
MKKLPAVVAALLLFFSCAPKQDPNNIKFMFWGDTEEIKIIADTVMRFQEENPGITVSPSRAPTGSFMEKLLTLIAADSAPDVIFVPVDNVAALGTKGALLDLKPYIDRDAFPISEYYPALNEAFSYKGKQLAIPRDIAPIACVYYNKKYFEDEGLAFPQEGWKWDDMLKAAKKLTKTDAKGNVKRFGITEDWNIWELWVLSNGGAYVDDSKNPKKLLLDSPEAAEAINYRRSLMHKHFVMPNPSQISSMGGMGSADMFLTGKTAMFVSGIWKTPMFRQITDFDWDIALFPSGPKAGRNYRVPGGAAGYGVIVKTKNPDASWKLVKYLAGDEGLEALAKTGLAQPSKMKIAQSPAFLDGSRPKNKKILLSAVDKCVFPPFTYEWDEIRFSHVFPKLDVMWYDRTLSDEDVEKRMKQMTEEVNRLFFKNEQ